MGEETPQTIRVVPDEDEREAAIAEVVYRRLYGGSDPSASMNLL